VRILPELGAEFGCMKSLEDRVARQRGEGALNIVRGEGSHTVTRSSRGSIARVTLRDSRLSAPDPGEHCDDWGER
jgi:hypothetical protein